MRDKVGQTDAARPRNLVISVVVSIVITCLGMKAQASAIFLEWRADRLVVATDSFQTNWEGHGPDNFDCKIVIQGKANNFLTVSGGVRTAPPLQFTVHGRSRTMTWDSQKLATEAYKSVKGPKDPGKVALEWQRMALNQLNSMPTEIRISAREIGENQMLFAGLLADGSIDVWVAKFQFVGNRFRIKVDRALMNGFVSLALGGEAANEIIKHQTPRSQREFKSWTASYNSSFHAGGDGERQTEFVPEILKWVIEHPPKTASGFPLVNGYVEAIRLLPKSTITWTQPCPKRPR
jgi:hypothetical protein